MPLLRTKTDDERTPLLQFPGMGYPPTPSPQTSFATNQHLQFCALVGMPPLPHPSIPKDVLKDMPKPDPNLLYQRAIRRRRHQNRVYGFTASLANTLLLSQVVLGAALTALGAAEQSHVLIALFGAMNTIIAGLVAYLKSRGQPMRARMYAEDLDRLVDDVENSATMWLGIAARVHGYDAIDTEDKVTVRGEVARLTRLWEAAVRRNVSNDPDMYASGNGGENADAGLKARRGAPGPIAPPVLAPAAAPAPKTPAAASVAGPSATIPPVAAPVSVVPAPPAAGPSVPLDPVKDAEVQTVDEDESPATAEHSKANGKKPEVVKAVDEPAPEPAKETPKEAPKEAPKEDAAAPPAPPVVKEPEASAPKPAVPASADAEVDPSTTLVSKSAGDNSKAFESDTTAATTATQQSATPSGQKANESLKRTPSGAPPGNRLGAEAEKN